MRYIEDLIKATKSTPEDIASKLRIHKNAIRHWRLCGVPKKYWEPLHEHFQITPIELATLTKACKKRNNYK